MSHNQCNENEEKMTRAQKEDPKQNIKDENQRAKITNGAKEGVKVTSEQTRS